MTYAAFRDETDRHYYRKLMTEAGGNMSKAARLAGIDRTSLYRAVQRLGLALPTRGAPVPSETVLAAVVA
jgi:transcriptional regulator of acetoin/glycerol metabolism